jgi:hypothetical protein
MRDPFSQRLHNEMNIRNTGRRQKIEMISHPGTAGTAETTGTYGRLEAAFV